MALKFDLRPCDVCGLLIDPDADPHWGHDDDCLRGDLHWCACDVAYHGACCPECASTDSVAVTLPRELVERMTGPWYLMKRDEAIEVRAALRRALGS